MGRSRAISTDDNPTPIDPLGAIVSSTYRLPETDEVFRCPIKALCISTDLSGQENDLVSALGIKGRYALVCDPNTFDVLGKRLSRGLKHADIIVLDAPKADDINAEDLSDKTRHADTLIAVGAGTLNDLCKHVSHQRGRPYLVFPTAPSMNGYTTATASISRDGEKLSLPAHPPNGVFIDLGILATAPGRLIRAGVGDALCRSTAQVDWLLSHLLLGTPYMSSPFELQRSSERALIEQTGQLTHGNLDAMRALVELLVLGGLGMLIVGNSQPGSQGEHLISHYIDMFCHPHPGTLHGEQVGLSTWTMTKLQHDILGRASPPVLREAAIDRQSLTERFGRLSPAFEKAIRAKAICGRRLDLMNEKLATHWPTLKNELNAAALQPDELKTAFEAVGVVTDASALGIDHHFYSEAVRHARGLRDRFTMLDLAADAGCLDQFIDTHLHQASSS